MAHPNGATLDPEWVRVGATVHALRNAYGLRQDELADRARVDRTMLVRVERGQRRLIPVNAVKIAAVLGVRPIAILNPTHFADEIGERVGDLAASVEAPVAAAAS